ncbi:putative cystathionine gamma-lyase 2 isoform X1 [Tachypleus tridentatus]|uniref:putative cystathionine gamma-lyase 2 isoform X1 n=1 Tax=Tachypleus tridentatus TaxID=6853 RepID=UPI003FD651DD
MKNGVSRFQMTTTFVDCTDVEKVRRALKSNTKLVWLESPTNPLMKVLDIKAIVEAVKADRPDILIAVDNTFSTPVFQQPLNLGADIVIHSLTKYMNGHCDVCLGSIVTRNKDIYQRLSFAQRNSEYSTLGVSFCFDSVHLLYTISGESNNLKPYLFWHERRYDPTRSAEKVSEESVDLFWKTIIPKACSSKQNRCLCVFWPTNIQNSLYKQE